jgi:hypothetical protein
MLNEFIVAESEGADASIFFQDVQKPFFEGEPFPGDIHLNLPILFPNALLHNGRMGSLESFQ